MGAERPCPPATKGGRGHSILFNILMKESLRVKTWGTRKIRQMVRKVHACQLCATARIFEVQRRMYRYVSDTVERKCENILVCQWQWKGEKTMRGLWAVFSVKLDQKKVCDAVSSVMVEGCCSIMLSKCGGNFRSKKISNISHLLLMQSQMQSINAVGLLLEKHVLG